MYSDLKKASEAVAAVERALADGELDAQSSGAALARLEQLRRLRPATAPTPCALPNVYHGVFAPHARRRGDAVRRAQEGAMVGVPAPSDSVTRAPQPDASALPASAPLRSLAPEQGAPTAGGASVESNESAVSPRSPPQGGYTRPLHYAWADLLRRTFAIDVLACPECGGRLRLLATIDDPAVVEKILRHLGLPIEPPAPARARAPTWLSATLPGFDGAADAADVWTH